MPKSTFYRSLHNIYNYIELFNAYICSKVNNKAINRLRLIVIVISTILCRSKEVVGPYAHKGASNALCALTEYIDDARYCIGVSSPT